MNQLPLYVVDAFTAIAFRGNPASVCLLERELPETTMQAIAAEMNHSETAFARPLDGAPARATRFGLRWFTPEVEVPLCGHATLAASAVIFRELANPALEVRFETKSGALAARREGPRIALDFPAEDYRPASVERAVITALGAADVLVWSSSYRAVREARKLRGGDHLVRSDAVGGIFEEAAAFGPSAASWRTCYARPVCQDPLPGRPAAAAAGGLAPVTILGWSAARRSGIMQQRRLP